MKCKTTPPKIITPPSLIDPQDWLTWRLTSQYLTVDHRLDLPWNRLDIKRYGMMLESITLEHTPSSHRVHVGLFRNVTNAEYLQSQLLGRNPDFQYAFVDATTIASRFHLLSAVYKAITIETSGSMKAPNIHSEIVCSLSSNNNVRLTSFTYPQSRQPSTTRHHIIHQPMNRIANLQDRSRKRTEDSAFKLPQRTLWW